MRSLSASGALALLAAFLTLGGTAGAADHDLRMWPGASGSARLGFLTANVQVQPRFQDNISGVDRLVLRPWVDIGFHDGWAAGFGYDAHWIESPRDQTEHRAWQQLTGRTDAANARIQHRLRIEERFLDGVAPVIVRSRYRLRLGYPFAGAATEFVTSNEVFFNFNGSAGGPSRGYDENRFFAGVARPAGPRAAVEAGYQLRHVRGARSDQYHHTIVFGIQYRLR